jgi:DNA-binding transcriptional MocR family regulator
MGKWLLKDLPAASLAERIRRYIDEGGFVHTDRLPPERELCRVFDVSRADLRKGLAALEADGLIWRHVGRGTFIGARPVHNLADVAFLGQQANPAQVLDASRSSRSWRGSRRCTRSGPTSRRSAPAPAAAGRPGTGAATRPGTTTSTTRWPRPPTTSC